VFDELLLRYRFTAAEETTEWQEAAIDPEMLGRAFESLMAARERHVSGAFFTPFALVARTTDTAVEAWLRGHGLEEGTLARAAEGVSLDAESMTRLRMALGDVRLVDPACGTGAFLVHALDRLTLLHLAVGDPRPAARVRREVIARSIFGVDINPTAVWLCELRLWLALVIDHPVGDPAQVPPLPNLDHNIRCGDTLSGGDFSHAASRDGTKAGRLRGRYARATGSRKRALARELDRLERTRHVAWLDARLAALAAERRDLLAAARGRNLFGARRGAVGGEAQALRELRASVRAVRLQRRAVASGGAMPFAYAARFPDAASAGGFDLVVGNPPWVRLHHLPVVDRERWRREYAGRRGVAVHRARRGPAAPRWRPRLPRSLQALALARRRRRALLPLRAHAIARAGGLVGRAVALRRGHVSVTPRGAGAEDLGWQAGAGSRRGHCTGCRAW
jgi:hypothetical protein